FFESPRLIADLHSLPTRRSSDLLRLAVMTPIQQRDKGRVVPALRSGQQELKGPFKNLKGDLAMRPIFHQLEARVARSPLRFLNGDRKSTRLNSSHVAISYAVFCL